MEVRLKLKQHYMPTKPLLTQDVILTLIQRFYVRYGRQMDVITTLGAYKTFASTRCYLDVDSTFFERGRQMDVKTTL